MFLMHYWEYWFIIIPKIVILTGDKNIGNSIFQQKLVHTLTQLFDRNKIYRQLAGTMPNVSRNAIVNVAEIVCYDVIKEKLLLSGLLQDGIPCHLAAAVAAGLCTTVAASPVDVVKTRYMNSAPGEYKGAIDAAMRMFANEGPAAFYKGFVPSFARLVSWNIVLWVTYEQIKLQARSFKNLDWAERASTVE